MQVEALIWTWFARTRVKLIRNILISSLSLHYLCFVLKFKCSVRCQSVSSHNFCLFSVVRPAAAAATWRSFVWKGRCVVVAVVSDIDFLEFSIRQDTILFRHFGVNVFDMK